MGGWEAEPSAGLDDRSCWETNHNDSQSTLETLTTERPETRHLQIHLTQNVSTLLPIYLGHSTSAYAAAADLNAVYLRVFLCVAGT